jgi:hypothetical protein
MAEIKFPLIIAVSGGSSGRFGIEDNMSGVVSTLKLKLPHYLPKNYPLFNS